MPTRGRWRCGSWTADGGSPWRTMGRASRRTRCRACSTRHSRPPRAGRGWGSRSPGGRSLGRSASLVRYNAAYGAVPEAADRRGRPRVTIPIPLGIIQFLHDHPHLSTDPAFHPDSARFNPILLANTLLNLPIYLEVKRAPTPTNDVVFGIGQDSLRVNLGAAAKLVPEDQLGFGGSSRLLDPGFGIKGVRVSVLGWLHYDVGVLLNDKLLAFLRDSVEAQPQTGYGVLGNGIAEAGFAPTVSYAGRIAGDSSTGLYLGGALHYYLGVAYARSSISDAEVV